MSLAKPFAFHPAFPPEVAHRAPPAGHWPPAWASAWGDDRFGLWADLECYDRSCSSDLGVGRLSESFVSSGGVVVIQRFRWVEPGSFLMGSPETEAERHDDEGPQHRVTLTQGFWLADTACTQALWQVVVGGENPSYFNGNGELPVENVSWDDVMEQFMPSLQALLPEGVEAMLPSEAQWEYACRAETQTPFSFGEQINAKQVNYDGNYPYNKGSKGEYREMTVPVKDLPSNAWGLFQMHGNVWEWCFDERRTYAEGEALDPLGAVGDDPRVLRGGSWFGNAGTARSAYRYENECGVRYHGIGFRVALRFKPNQTVEP